MKAVKPVKAGGYKYKPKTIDGLKRAIRDEIKLQGNNADLNCIDTSLITYMAELFDQSEFNGDISKWNVSNVDDMSYMFSGSPFNGDISNWDVSNVTNMEWMFENSEFTGDISNWDVSNVEIMEHMFENTKFNGDISKWDVSNVTTMESMFCNSEFNGDISNWDVSNVYNMTRMFNDSKFNGDLSKWNVSRVIDMTQMFSESAFNGDISNWDVSNVKEMAWMFSKNQNIVNLNLSNFNLTAKTIIRNMFVNCYNLETLFLGNVDNSKLEDIKSWFDCGNLKFIAYTDNNNKANISIGDNKAKNVDEVDNNIRDMISEAIRDERNRFRLSGNWYTRKVVNEYDETEIPYDYYYYQNNDLFLIFINNNRHITMYSNFDPKQFTL